jgi:hypothetical protein
MVVTIVSLLSFSNVFIFYSTVKKEEAAKPSCHTGMQRNHVTEEHDISQGRQGQRLRKGLDGFNFACCTDGFLKAPGRQ